jgi:hypothetical protein
MSNPIRCMIALVLTLLAVACTDSARSCTSSPSGPHKTGA